jgi:hypothetical protein
MGKFTSWASGLVDSVTDVVGDSVRLAKKTFGAAPTDAQADAAALKVQGVVKNVETLIAEAIDEIPGVPRVVAKFAAAAVASILMSAVAGATEAVKENN